MTKTDELRDALVANGIEYKCGLTILGSIFSGERVRVNQDTVTVAYPVPGDPRSSISFEEEDGELVCLDSLTVSQCVAAVMG